MRQAVIERAHGLCEYCYSQQKYCPDPFVCDHIEPVSLDGGTTLDNLALACDGCNGKKRDSIAAVDILIGEIVSLYHPRNDVWEQHFRWSDDFLTLVGASPTGRATIARLDLNRVNVVNLRRLLVAFRERPPAPIAG